MKIRYKDYSPQGPTLAILRQADKILHEYAADQYKLTVRQLYYVFISKDLFPPSWVDEEYNRRQGLAEGTLNTMKNYARLKDICTKGREGGFLDWDHFTDRSRELEKNPHWQNPERFLDNVCRQFKLDLWLGQPRRVEVWVEKEALSEVIGRACWPLDVPFFACKGYASASSVWEAARYRFLLNYGQKGQTITILHLSDHDPSGIDMTRDLRDRLRLYSTPTDRCGVSNAPRIRVRRLALTMAQIEEYDPPSNPAKESDARYRAYQTEHGDECFELDALMIRPGVMVTMIEEAIHEEMEDPELFEGRQRLQETALELSQISSDYSGIMEHLGLEHLDCGDEPD